MMKLSIALVLVFAGTTLGSIEKRIVGSKTCDNERQYHVQITALDGGKTCGGALINTRWVITAAHCAGQNVKLQLALNSGQSVFQKASSWIKSVFKGTDKVTEQTITTKQQFPYKDENGDKLHDIMLIKLNNDMSVKVPIIKLPPTEGCPKLDQSTEVQIGGFGAKKAGGKAPSSLKCGATEISACGENDKPDSKYASDEGVICAHRPGVEACSGDSGSAVEHNKLLHGIIVSSPVDTCVSPIVMLDICNYRKWIDNTMRSNP